MRKIYFNGNFITLEDKKDVNAILIEDGIIKKVGAEDEILEYRDNNTELIDLNGKIMMPSFIDSHSHFIAVANEFLQVSLKECKSFDDIRDKLIEYKNRNNIEDGKWIIANGYDSNNLVEKKNITKKELDLFLPNNPVVLQHQSGHNGVMNSLALNQIGITDGTESPEGGRIEKVNGKITGYLEENVFIQNLKKVPMPTIKDLKEAIKKAERIYASYGITTVQEGFLAKELINIYQEIINNNEVGLDIVGYVDKNIIEDVEKIFSKNIKKYYNHFKINGIKIFLDGSPQARTAWMREPYNNDTNYCGYGTMSDEDVEKAIKLAVEKKLQILAHCNGDRASKQYIDTIEKIKNTENIKYESQNIRPVLIHGQLLGIDQLDEVKKLGIIPSFFVAHVYYYGDVHIENFGLERASRISPAGSSLKKEIPFTFHQDSPVIEPNMLETIWCAVNRKTKNGLSLGKEEEIDVLDAIKAVTINAAYQYFEENEKGSIREGKRADLIILDKNPLTEEKENIKNIKVLETIKDGETIYRAF